MKIDMLEGYSGEGAFRRDLGHPGPGGTARANRAEDSAYQLNGVARRPGSLLGVWCASGERA